MEAFQKLLSVLKTLLGPGGCPWDQKQTLNTLEPYLIEEVFELVEAIDKQDSEHILEEAGDLFQGLLFLIQVAEKEKRFTLEEVLHYASEKLIRRHPHIFDRENTAPVHDEKELMKRWNEIKKNEKGKTSRKSVFDEIPPKLPVLMKAQKIVRKLKLQNGEKFSSEKELADALFSCILKAEQSGFDVETVLRQRLVDLEKNRA